MQKQQGEDKARERKRKPRQPSQTTQPKPSQQRETKARPDYQEQPAHTNKQSHASPQELEKPEQTRETSHAPSHDYKSAPATPYQETKPASNAQSHAHALPFTSQNNAPFTRANHLFYTICKNPAKICKICKIYKKTRYNARGIFKVSCYLKYYFCVLCRILRETNA
ncbi:hypothetical protein [Helicobacter himalayensis]|uniref:hypothetical protein n=1 Tax=Helicobacter himalayensis TaxID=1591088 RepID=UPI0012E8EC62|nr:hypothetical protein [Helicobacter himalayensis]